MLRELHISNLAIIEDAHVEFGEGLNCFTGQTGAGKSLILGSFELLLGLRKAGDLLRDGADEGRVSGVFDLLDADLVEQVKAAADVDLDPEDGAAQLLITRKLFASGRTSVSINGQPATIHMLQRIGELLVDVHGQHDHQFLLKPANQLAVLDRFAEAEALREQYAALHHEHRELVQRREQLSASAALRRQQLELYEFQANEIDEAEPTEGEYEELSARHRVLSNLERIMQQTGQTYAALYESEGAIVERLQAVVAVLRELAELDGQIAAMAEEARAALSQLQDLALSLNRYHNRLDLDPAELGEVEARLNTLNRLVAKYGSGRGGTIDEVIAFRRQIGDQIDQLRHDSDDQASIDAQLAPLVERMQTVGRQLSEARRAAGERLCPLVESQLAELGMSEAKLEVRLDTDTERDSPTGFDQVELLVRPNPGQSPRPLRQIASGGELSRIMLAVKSILATSDRISVLVFDEVDANIGGRMGTVIGRKLRGLSRHHQVLCITHLPQIAAYADRHLRIAKAVQAKQTRTTVTQLDARPRLEELADKLAGSHRTQTTQMQAGEQLDAAASDGPDAPAPPPRSRRSPPDRRQASPR